MLGPDLRVALVARDALTISRVEGRQHLSPGWVSHILQQIAALLLREKATAQLLGTPGPGWLSEVTGAAVRASARAMTRALVISSGRAQALAA